MAMKGIFTSGHSARGVLRLFITKTKNRIEQRWQKSRSPIDAVIARRAATRQSRMAGGGLECGASLAMTETFAIVEVCAPFVQMADEAALLNLGG